MMKEKEIIDLFSGLLKRPAGQLNGPFESDAEVVPFGGGLLAFSVDEYTEADDFFSSLRPETLGWNLAVATISDLLATGSDPTLFSHACTIPDSFDRPFLEDFARGIARALESTGASFIGGDLSWGDAWRYVGVAMGTVSKPDIMMRNRLEPGDSIYVTGTVGEGNQAAFMAMLRQEKGEQVIQEFPPELFAPRFECRVDESRKIRRHARCCIDTSDGLARSLDALEAVNDCALEIDASVIPYGQSAAAIAGRFGMPKELLALAGAGEYELLFTVPAGDRDEFEAAARSQANATRIGAVTEGEGIWFRPDASRDLVRYSGQDMDPRQFPDKRLYIKTITEAVQRLFYS